ncbi:DMT family transporter [Geobacillus sp. YF-1]|uniref:DMT family transporter n=1 Tax=Geobacillus sp. YF-1 TaxID=3457480 RepID=UPI0040455E1F
MSWFFLLFGIIFEVIGTTCMKLSKGFMNIIPSILLFLFYGLSLTFVTLSLKKLNVGVAYAVWSGLGTVLITIIGITFFQESYSFVKMTGILLIIIGVIILHFYS